MTYRIERLPNGLILLFCYACRWNVCYNADGTYRHGGRNHPKYAAAVAAWLRAGN